MNAPKYASRRPELLRWLRPARPPRTRRSRLHLEMLEDRAVPSAFGLTHLSLSGSQTLVPGANVNASNNAATGESEMQITINPANPLQVAGFTHNVYHLNDMSVYHSADGGVTWGRTIINEDDDGLGSGTRFDPTIKFDAAGRLFIAYGFAAGSSVTLIAARSDNGGISFFQFPTLDSHSNVGSLPGVDKWFMATGSDALGGQAVYVTYTRNTHETFGTDQQIRVVGSNDGGNTFTSPRLINDDSNNTSSELGMDSSLFAGPAVGPNGELYVVWHDIDDGQLKFDRDLSGLFKGAGFATDVVVKTLRENMEPKFTPASPRRGFFNGPSIDVDRVNFVNRIYVTFTDTFSGDDTDIYLVSSDDNGAHWTSVGGAGNVEASLGTDFMATVAVDQTSGSINVGYYSTKDDPSGNDDVNFCLASSIDGGATFTKVNLSSATSRASAMANGNEFGDYVGLAAYGGTVRGFWTDNRGLSADSEAFTATASFHSSTGGNTLVIFGLAPILGLGGNDTIQVRRSPVNSNYVENFTDGACRYGGLFASIDRIQISASGGNDHISIDSSAAGIPISILGGSDDDTIDLSSASGNLNDLQAAMTIDGGDGSDTLTLWDDHVSFQGIYTITNTTVSRLLFGGLTYSTIEGLTLNAPLVGSQFAIQSTHSGTLLTVNANGGDDLADLALPSGNLSSIAGPVVFNGGNDGDVVRLWDNLVAFGDGYTITSSTVSRPGFAGLTYGTIEGLNLNEQAGANTLTVSSTAAGTLTRINGQDGGDIYNVTAAAVTGVLILNGGGSSVADQFNIDVGLNPITLSTGGPGQLRFQVTGAGPIYTASSFSSFSLLHLAPDSLTLSLNGGGSADGAADTTTLGRFGDSLTARINSFLSLSLPMSAIHAVLVNRTTDADNLVVDFSGGNPIPAAGMGYDGGPGPDDQLTLQGGSFDTVTYTPSGAGSGTVTLDSSVITYTGLEPIVDTTTATNVVLNATDDGESINLVNGSDVGGMPTMEVNSGSSTFERVDFANKANVTVNAGGGADTISIEATPAGTPVTVNAGAGDDTVLVRVVLSVGNPAMTLDGGDDANTLQGPDVSNLFTVNALNGGTLGTQVLFSNFHNLQGGTIDDTFAFSGLAAAVSGTVDGGTGPNTLDYSSDGGEAIPVNLQSSSATRINGGAAGGFANITTLVGSAATDTLIGRDVVNTWTVGGNNKGNIGGTFFFRSVESLVGGGDNDTFRFFSGAAKLTGTIDGMGGTDKLDYASDGGISVVINLATSAATRIKGGAAGGFAGIEAAVGSAAVDTLRGPNADTTWSITGTNAGKAGTFAFSKIERLVGGTAADTFTFAAAAAATVGTIDGGGGADWLDYAALLSTDPVTVNLATGSASRVGGGAAGAVLHIRHVAGGAGDDHLTGNDLGNILLGNGGNDVLTAGAGRSILVGGDGSDQLNGGGGQDILIGGRTIYDGFLDRSKLVSIFQEWLSGKDYETRVANIKTGGGLTGGNKLELTTTVLNDAGALDTLTGNAARDWFFQFAGDTIADLNNGGPEQVN
jgi:hypothetical protein